MLPKYVARTLSVLAIAAIAISAQAQTVTVKEDFTGATTTNTWLAFNGACLTAGSAASSSSDQTVLPGCLKDTYYNVNGSPQMQWGGANGCLGTTPGSSGTCSGTQQADPAGSGALRLTNGSALSGSFANGYAQNGAILSNFNFASDKGIQITFKTVTYGGNSGGNGGSGSVSANDGADGITFFLLDDSIVSQSSWNTPLDSGAFGGSLGYTCSNTNNDSTTRSDGSQRGYDGIIGGYIGLGVDEYGNYLNPGDNTSSGPGLQADRIGLRGAGSVSWKWLHQTYPNNYPSSWTTSQQYQAVQNTCKAGYLMDYHQPKDSHGNITQYGYYYTSTGSSPTTSTSFNSNAIAVMDYPMIKDASGNGAYKVLTSVKIANEASTKSVNGSTVNVPITRSQATPITYNLQITQNNKLSFSYSYNGGTWQPVITAVDITNSNGALPSNVRFGFAGSDGGSSNVHEILCFAAQPAEASGSSGGINVYQNPTIKSNTQIFLANYFPSTWTGQLTAQTIGFNGTTVVANTVPNWDARCVLSGNDPSTGLCDSTNTTVSSVEDWKASDGRQILTWDPVAKTPVAFEWPGTGVTYPISSAMQTTIGSADTLNFIRGDRSNEIGGTSGKNLFRTRTAVLGDIVDSSPTWVGPPQTYTNMDSWVDSLYPPGSTSPATPPENSGQKYSAFQSTYTATQKYNTSGATASDHGGRTNVVYVGANDGFVHGFRAGSLDYFGNLLTGSAGAANDGYEVIAYMPSPIFQSIHNTNVTEWDYPNTLYSHNWYVDATPGTGDLFYACATGTLPNCQSGNGTWHTWLVGGLGAGGAGIYALDITNPSSSTFSESNPSVVIGDWTPSNITCQIPAGAANQTAACGAFMGNTYGTPLIRRFHNGSWGVIFGNGYGTPNGYAGIFIMLINPTTGAKTFYYLPAGTPTATGNGIGPTTSADLDLDHIVDYIYAGDVLGNLWRFDVTSQNPANWAVRSTAIFTTPNNQPITTAVTVSTLKTIQTSFTGKVLDTKPERVMINFGTGQQIPSTLTAGTQYATAQQTLYGVYDWDMTNWNSLSTGQQAIVLKSGSGPAPITQSNLVSQSFTTTTSGGTTYRQVGQGNAVCFPDSKAGPGPNNPPDSRCSLGSDGDTKGNAYGWYMNLTLSNSLAEQVVFDPTLNGDGLFIVNTYIPTANSPLNCNPGTSTGFTMALEPTTGQGAPAVTGSSGSGYFILNSGNVMADGVQLNGIGTPTFISTGSQGGNAEYMLTQGNNGLATPTPVSRHSVVAGQRLNWVQRR